MPEPPPPRMKRMPSYDTDVGPARERSSSKIHVCLLGSAASGKTCFLAGLGLLADNPNAPGPLTVLATGETHRTLNAMAQSLKRQEWPDKTKVSQRIDLDITCDNVVVDFSALDYQGEDFTRLIRDLDDPRLEWLKQHLAEADVFLLFFDPDDVLNCDNERLRALLDVIQAVKDRLSDDSAAALHVACVLTKVDRHPELKIGRHCRSWLQTKSPNLLKRLEDFAPSLGFFPISAVGKTQTVERQGKRLEVPFALPQPTGYVELIRWIVSERQKHRTRHRRRALLALSTLIGLCLFFAGVYQTVATCNNSVATDEQVIEENLFWEPIEFSGTKKRRTTLLAAKIDGTIHKVETVHSEADAVELGQQFEQMIGDRSIPASLYDRVRLVRGTITQKREDIRFKLVQDAYENKETTRRDLSTGFLRDFPSGEHSDAVRRLIAEQEGKDREDYKTAIKSVIVENPATAREKADKIDDYLKSFGSQENATVQADLRKAADLARLVSTPRPYTVRLKKSGKFASDSYKHKVDLVFTNQGRDQRVTWESPSKASEITWDAKSQQVEWQIGDNIRVELHGIGAWYGNGLAAVGAIQHRFPLLKLGGTTWILKSTEEWQSTIPTAEVIFQVEDYGPAELDIIERYLDPGTNW